MITPFNSVAGRMQTDGLPAEVAVGWSGGADSTALLLMLQQQGYRVQAWHVDHGWRESSIKETELLAEKARGWEIELRVARLPAPSGRNREAEARKGRYAQFEQWSEATGITTLCLGHHRDDQAETVCMRMLQGAGISGCRGMQQRRRHGRLDIFRPLLQVKAGELKAALRAADINWLEDPSNNDMTIWRNRIRQGLFPAMQRAGVSPSELFLRWQVQAERLGQQIDSEAQLLLGDISLRNQGVQSASVPWLTWSATAAPIRVRMLQKMMAFVLGEGVTPGRRHILMIEAWTQRGGHGGLDLSRCRLLRSRKDLHLRRTAADLSS
ncbi:tRNA lysidine(34) synthetase TilS [Mariprofundus ferrooxydans]|uniref:tRNA lysidine(34) synthetase TilS n=1 Tax=Mariprofundus ferrooxydans TaxID=314344 RepID=UPI00037CEBD8|nr:tRNA lysidine(34) synthetase TilS [Mariprofundus ferrooxydans]